MSLAAIASSSSNSALKKSRKHRCWEFNVKGIGQGARRNEADILPPFRARYTSVKRLVLGAVGDAAKATSSATPNPPVLSSSKSLRVVVEFTGPQPSSGPGALLCTLLSGASVDAQPIQLERGRKRKIRPGAGSNGSSSCTTAPSSPCDGATECGPTVGGTKLPEERRLPSPVENVSANEKQKTLLEDASKGDGKDSVAAPPSARDGGSLADVGSPRDVSVAKIESETNVVPPPPLGSTAEIPPCSPVGCKHATVPPLAVEGAKVATARRPAVVERSVEVNLNVDVDPEPVSEPLSPARKCPRTLLVDSTYVEKLSSSVGLLSIVDSDSEDESGSDSELLPLVDKGCWGNEDFGGALSPLDVQPHFRSWSVDSTHEDFAFTGRDTFGALSDIGDALLFGTEAEAIAASEVFDEATDAGADAGAGDRQAMDDDNVKGFSEVALSTNEISVTLVQKECDFKGRSEPAPGSVNQRSLVGVSSSSLSQIVFTGLESAGHNLGQLTATAHFWIDPGYTLGQIATPIQVGTDGQVHASVRYPSMQDLWPEVYRATNIRVVEVDVMVEVRSKDGEFEHIGQQQTVTYRRPPWPTERRGLYPEASCQRISTPSETSPRLNPTVTAEQPEGDLV